MLFYNCLGGLLCVTQHEIGHTSAKACRLGIAKPPRKLVESESDVAGSLSIGRSPATSDGVAVAHSVVGRRKSYILCSAGISFGQHEFVEAAASGR